MLGAFFAEIEEGYLEALAFAESPERYAVSGPFDVSRFYFSQRTRERATAHVREFWRQAFARGVDLTAYDARDVGRCFAYDRNGHGTGFADMASMPEAAREQLSEIAGSMGPCEPTFRTRGDAICMGISI